MHGVAYQSTHAAASWLPANSNAESVYTAGCHDERWTPTIRLFTTMLRSSLCSKVELKYKVFTTDRSGGHLIKLAVVKPIEIEAHHQMLQLILHAHLERPCRQQLCGDNV